MKKIGKKLLPILFMLITSCISYDSIKDNYTISGIIENKKYYIVFPEKPKSEISFEDGVFEKSYKLKDNGVSYNFSLLKFSKLQDKEGYFERYKADIESKNIEILSIDESKAPGWDQAGRFTFRHESTYYIFIKIYIKDNIIFYMRASGNQAELDKQEKVDIFFTSFHIKQ